MRSVGTLRAVLFVGAFISVTACGGGDARGRTLRASLGSYEDGSGRVGLAVLATLRDGSGAGPASTWTLTLRDADGEIPVTIDYAAPGRESYVVRWRADVAPRTGTYELVATGDGGETARATVTLDAVGGLPLPAPALSSAGDRVTWPSVAGAAAYLCRVYEGGVLRLEALAAKPECDVAALPAGAFAASITALSFDPRALASGPVPEVPERFDASESAFAFVRGTDAAGAVIRTAGGAYDNGVGPRSFAAWLAITAADGSATADAWELEITGPGLPAADPIRSTYFALFPRQMLWAPGVPASPGVYTVTARSGTTALSAPIVIGAPAWLDLPFGVTATAGAQGSARASWNPVAGARCYLASAYDVETGEVEIALWVGGSGVEFPPGSFVPGRAYEVLVSASDADMVWGAIVPTQVSVAENVFERASFIAR